MLNQKQIAELIPHDGNMCLLTSVKYWDENKIACISYSHTDVNNPLRNSQGLPMISLLEYAAQAMAIHGCLASEHETSSMKQGYLAALQNVKLAEGDLSDVEGALEIHVERLFKDAGNMIYTLKIQVKNKILASGRATVMAKFSEENN